MEAFEYEGQWWLPQDSEKTVSGTLHFSPDDGATLNLIGSFKEVRIGDQMIRPDIILGSSAKGKRITLFRCMETHKEVSYPGFSVSSFYVGQVFVGVHFPRPEDVKFKRIFFRCSYIDDWVAKSGFDIQEKDDPYRLVVEFNRPEPIEGLVNDDLKILIHFQLVHPSRSTVQKEVNVKQKAWIEIVTKEEKSFDEYTSIMYHIQNFMSLGTARPIYTVEIDGRTEANQELVEGKALHLPIKIYYKQWGVPRQQEDLHPFDMLFTLNDILGDFRDYLGHWLEKADRLEPVYNLYFGTLHNPNMYLQHEFLSLAQAMESYHRRVFNNRETADEEHAERIKCIIEATREKYRDWLIRKLEHSNEPTLRKRLTETCDKFSEIVDSFIPDRAVFINKVVATRHYLTHYDPRRRPSAADRSEMYYLTETLKILVEVCLLGELGMDNRRINFLFGKSFMRKRQLDFLQSKLNSTLTS